MTPPEALDALRAGKIMLIDIRRPDEWMKTGVAEGAQTLDLRRDDFVEALTRMADGDLDRPIALICARGVRSDRTGTRLTDAGFTQIIDIPEGPAQHVRCDLSVQNLRRDIGVVGRDLPPALGTGFVGHPDEAHEFRGERFDPRQSHRVPPPVLPDDMACKSVRG